MIIDVSATTFLDSHAINALFDVATEASKAQHVAVMQLGTTPIVERILELVQVGRVLTRVDTRPEAIDAIEQRVTG